MPDSSAPAVSTRRLQAPSVATVVGGLAVLWGFVIGSAPLGDNSLFTHLATGRLLAAGTFPRFDPYSYTAAGEPWVVQSWLVSGLYAFTERLAGPAGVQLVAGVAAAALAGLVWWLTRPADGLMGRVGITAMVVAIGGVAWSPRPLLFGLLFLTVGLHVAEGRIPPWVLAPVMWCWVNSHGSFPLLLVALGCLALGRKLDGQDPRVELRALAWAAGGTAIGVISPLGVQALRFPIDLVGKQDVLRNIIEWQSPDFSATWTRIFLVQVAVAVLLLVRRPGYRAAIPLVVFLAAALSASRNIPVASIVLVPGMAHGLAGVGSITGKERTRAAALGLAAVAVVLVGAAVVRVRGPHWDLAMYPTQAIAWVDAQGGLDGNSRLATQDVVGNYLELTVGPDLPVYFDDRVDMYPPPVVRDYLALHRGTGSWPRSLDNYEVDVVIWDRSAPLAEHLRSDPSWHVGYEDASSIVACRRGSVLWCPEA